MSERTIVVVDSTIDAPVLIKLDRAPKKILAENKFAPFACDPDQMPSWANPAAVLEYGKCIQTALLAHPAISKALDQVLGTAPQEIHALFFLLKTDEAERFYWEALCSPKGEFLALDHRWPIVRMADSSIDRERANKAFRAPLKITAVLSALGIKAETEWQKLKQAMQPAVSKGFAIQLTVVVGEEALHDQIKAEIKAKKVVNTTVKLLSDNLQLESVINQSEPHILHFFCHGQASHGNAQIELGSVQDWAAESATSSVIVNVDDLLNLPAFNEVWLVTLNCCEGGKATDRLHSMAHQLVANGIPAAVGMLEPIDALDAHEFCAGFYQALLQQLQTKVKRAKAGAEIEVDWSQALRDARAKLVQRHANDPKNNRQWTLPALYVQPDRFQFRLVAKPGSTRTGDDKGPPPPDLVALQKMLLRANEVADFLRSLPPNTPAAVRQKALALLADIPPELRPDAEGKFKHG